MNYTPFEPDDAALEDGGIFGLPVDETNAHVHIVPVPFDATTSYRKGAWAGPAAILRASRQVELFEPFFGKPYRRGIFYREPDERIEDWNDEASDKADPIIAVGGRIEDSAELAKKLARVNEIGAELNDCVRDSVDELLGRKKLPVVLGGDHAVPFGAIEACSKRFRGLGVLHFDAHADLREAYEGFTWSHASIMFNVTQRLDGVAKLVQVGIRDFGEREYERIVGSKGRIHTLFDSAWQRAKLDGTNLRELVRKTIDLLPEHVYVSFDIDGLDPTLCPSTGTPVPGGLTWPEALVWLEELARAKKHVVGLDLNEVNPGTHLSSLLGDEIESTVDSWDAIVGARLLYRMIGAALHDA